MRDLGQGIAVIGAQWGDEGKGRVVDVLSEVCDLIVRFQGGNNAGHSLQIGSTSLVLHLIPCGIVRSNKQCLIGNGVVIDPFVLFQEIDALNSMGIYCGPENLKISKTAHVILPDHKILDKKREESAKNPIGTTMRGIGPCYQDKIARVGIRVQDLLREHQWDQRLKPYLVDVGELLEEALRSGKRVMFEGAQGSLLDVDHGSYPFVTSSNCVAAAASCGTGIGPKWLSDIFLVTKGYCTRVGEGPFFSEADEEMQKIIRQNGNEFGATTKRPRRCGYLDLPSLKYAARINSATGILLTKVDILTNFLPLRVCIGYENAQNFLHALELEKNNQKVYPKYIELPKVESFSGEIKSKIDLPLGVQKLCDLIEDFVEVKIKLVCFGAKRGDELWLN